MCSASDAYRKINVGMLGRKLGTPRKHSRCNSTASRINDINENENEMIK